MIRQFKIRLIFLQINFKIFVYTRGPLQGLRPARTCGCCGALNTALLYRTPGKGTFGPVKLLRAAAPLFAGIVILNDTVKYGKTAIVTHLNEASET